MRRIPLRRDGKEDLILMTDLDDPTTYPADDLLEIYLQRWGIESMFQQVGEVFQLGRLIGTTPRATIFQSALCFLLFNRIQVIRAYVAVGRDAPANSVSTENRFCDVRRQLIAWTEMLQPQQTVELTSAPSTAAQVRRRLQKLLQRQWSERWIKSPSNTHKKRRQHRTAYPRGGHSSSYRILATPSGST